MIYTAIWLEGYGRPSCRMETIETLKDYSLWPIDLDTLLEILALDDGQVFDYRAMGEHIRFIAHGVANG